MGSKRSVYFYEVEAFKFDADANKVEVTIDEVLTLISTLSPDKKDNPNAVRNIGGTDLSCHIIKSNDDVFCGQFGKLNADLPRGVKNSTVVKMTFPEDTDPFEASYFVYFRESKILAMEWSNRAPKHLKFSSYLIDLAHSRSIELNEVDFAFCISKPTVAKIREIGKLTRVKLSVHSSQLDNMGDSRIISGLKSQKEKIRGDYHIKLDISPVVKTGKSRGFDAKMKADVINMFRFDAGFFE
jgi:hypothetical protein